jgi:hypothetical protein
MYVTRVKNVIKIATKLTINICEKENVMKIVNEIKQFNSSIIPIILNI